MTTEEVIQQFINYLGDKKLTEDEVKRYFMNRKRSVKAVLSA